MRTSLLSVLFAVSVVPVAMTGRAAAEPRVIAETSEPDAAGVYKVGGDVMAPIVLAAPQPGFTEEARQEKVSGSCTVALIVGADGVPRDVKVVRSVSVGQPEKGHDAAVSLDKKALEAVQMYRFKPALRAGVAVPVALRIVVNFQVF